MLPVPRRERVPSRSDGVLASYLPVDSVGDTLTAADVAEDLGRPTVGLALRVVRRASASGARLGHDPAVSTLDYITSLRHQMHLPSITNARSHDTCRRRWWEVGEANASD